MWDCFLGEGEAFLLLTTVGVLQIMKPKILRSSLEELCSLMHEPSRHVPVDELFAAISTSVLTASVAQHLLANPPDEEWFPLHMMCMGT